jgi:hypothetical protein
MHVVISSLEPKGSIGKQFQTSAFGSKLTGSVGLNWVIMQNQKEGH